MNLVTTACCGKTLEKKDTIVYRRKRWCGNDECLAVIDEKVKEANLKKRERKIAAGTYRNGVDKELRQVILERDDWTCGLCSVQDDSHGVMQVHHIVPVSCGGSDDLDNLITVCKSCHISIHEKGWETYVTSLKKNV